MRRNSLSQLPRGTSSNPRKILGLQIKKANHVEQTRHLQQAANWLVSVQDIELEGDQEASSRASPSRAEGISLSLLRLPPTPPPQARSISSCREEIFHQGKVKQQEGAGI